MIFIEKLLIFQLILSKIRRKTSSNSFRCFLFLPLVPCFGFSRRWPFWLALVGKRHLKDVWAKPVNEPRSLVENKGVEPKIGVGKPPKSSHFNKVFHYFHHPIWGTPIFGNTHKDKWMTEPGPMLGRKWFNWWRWSVEGWWRSKKSK